MADIFPLLDTVTKPLIDVNTHKTMLNTDASEIFIGVDYISYNKNYEITSPILHY